MHNLPICYDRPLPFLFFFPLASLPSFHRGSPMFLDFPLVIILHDKVIQGLFLARLSSLFLIFLGNLIHILALAAVHMQPTQPKRLSCIQDAYNIPMNCQKTVPVFPLRISCVLVTSSRHSFWVSPLMDCALIHSVNPGSSLSPPRTRSLSAVHYILSRVTYIGSLLSVSTATPTPTSSVLFWIIKWSPCLWLPLPPIYSCHGCQNDLAKISIMTSLPYLKILQWLSILCKIKSKCHDMRRFGLCLIPLLLSPLILL